MSEKYKRVYTMAPPVEIVIDCKNAPKPPKGKYKRGPLPEEVAACA